MLGARADAEMVDPSIGPDEIGPVSIAMNDNAKDACWTNLKEVREYAEEKLRTKGYDLGDDSEAMLNYTLAINVDAFRSKGAPTCIGSIIVTVLRAAPIDQILGFHVIHMENVVASSSLNGNLNQSVIEIVQRTIDGM
jgi:hypothetical protein